MTEDKALQQAALDATWNRFLVERAKPGYRPGACVYRGPDDCRCAVGNLMHEVDYRPEFEGAGIAPTLYFDQFLQSQLRADDLDSSPVLRGLLFDNLGKPRGCPFLTKIQNAHDMAAEATHECVEANSCQLDVKSFDADGFRQRLESELRIIASVYGLEVPA